LHNGSSKLTQENFALIVDLIKSSWSNIIIVLINQNYYVDRGNTFCSGDIYERIIVLANDNLVKLLIKINIKPCMIVDLIVQIFFLVIVIT